MRKTSIRGAVRDAKREDAKARASMPPSTALVPIASGTKHHAGAKLSAGTWDSFVNFAHKLGVGADNALTSGSYGFNPITRNRTLLEWIHRGSWLGGVAVDIVADDMTRAGVEFVTEMEPADQEKIERKAAANGVWDVLNETLKWGRLYGGAIAVMLIDGQDMKTPLRVDTVGPDQFKGLIALDRWMLEPSLEDLVTEFGPDIGKPKYYKVLANAPALRGQVIHYSRIALRCVGVKLSHQQAMTENLWGISVLERLYDRMVAFDSASTGAAQLVFKAHLRTLQVDGLREIVAAGGQPLNGLVAYTDMMRRFQGIEGITLLDKDDLFDVQTTTAFSGVKDIINALGSQIAGALRMPMTRLFGEAPGGLSTDDQSGMRLYHDTIHQDQTRDMSRGVHTVYALQARSLGIALPDGFALEFASLERLDDTKKADVAGKVVDAVSKALDEGIITQKVAMQELRQSSRTTGIFTNITAADIEAADEDVVPPMSELDTQLALREAEGGSKDGDDTDGSKRQEKPLGGGRKREPLVRE